MLKLVFLRKGGLELTNSYYYAFYSTKTNFDTLTEQEKNRIREASGVEGFVECKGKILKNGYREKGLALLSSLNTTNLPYTIEELYCNFLNSLADAGESKRFNPNYDRTHERSGKYYHIDSFLNKRLVDFVKMLNSSRSNHHLYLDSFSGDKETQNKSIVDIDRMEVDQAFVGSKPKNEMERIDSNVSFKDTLLVLKFFESYFQIAGFIQYIKKHDTKSQHTELRYHYREVEKKTGTAPKYNYQDIDLETNRSQLLKRMGTAPESVTSAAARAIESLYKLIVEGNIKIDNIPDDLIDDKYMYSLKNDTFLSLTDYIENRIATDNSEYLIDGVSVYAKERSGDIFTNTVKILKMYKPKFNYSDILEFLTSNLPKYRELHSNMKEKYEKENLSVTEMNKKLMKLNKTIERQAITLKTGQDPKTKIYLNKNQLYIAKAGLKKSLEAKQELVSKIEKAENKYTDNPYDAIYRTYITHLNAYKRIYSRINSEIIMKGTTLLMTDTVVGQDIYSKLQKIYGIRSAVLGQNKLTLDNKLTMNSKLMYNIKSGPWIDIGGGWYGAELSDKAQFIPKLITPEGNIIDPLNHKVIPLYGQLFGMSINIDEELYREVFDSSENQTILYRQFYSSRYDEIVAYMRWSVAHGDNKQRV
ncbi:hypothetical protein [Clostridium tertium]|uniref:hypothetical protein n=1 Tax=Clostridium tertium TaxID=1559 RepID=UPI0023B24375|nr:hypothetical protein [Clostridium tertium]